MAEELSVNTEPPLVSVVVPTLNRPQAWQRLLRELLQQTYRNFELIIVDQSDNATSGAEQPAIKNMIYLKSGKKNLPEARNLGIKKAKGKIVLFLDDDVSVEADFIEQHVAAIEKHRCAGITGKIKQPMAYETSLFVDFDESNMRMRKNTEVETAGETITALGGNMSFRSVVFRETGLFDTGFIGNALWEETDFSFRLRKKGQRIFYEPAARLVHLAERRGGCWRQGRGAYLFCRFHNETYFFFKHLKWRDFLRLLKRQVWDLEYFSREGRPRRSLLLVLFGLAGIPAGMLRFMIRRISGRI